MTDVASLKALGGADLTKLEVGTKLYVETTKAVYGLTVLDSAGTVMIESAEAPFVAQTPTRCELVRSDWDDKGKVNIPHWIGKAMRMILRRPTGKLMATHSVVSTRVEAADGSWAYEIWETKPSDRKG